LKNRVFWVVTTCRLVMVSDIWMSRSAFVFRFKPSKCLKELRSFETSVTIYLLALCNIPVAFWSMHSQSVTKTEGTLLCWLDLVSRSSI